MKNIFLILVAHLLFFFKETSILVLRVVDTALPYSEGFLKEEKQMGNKNKKNVLHD